MVCGDLTGCRYSFWSFRHFAHLLRTLGQSTNGGSTCGLENAAVAKLIHCSLFTRFGAVNIREKQKKCAGE